MPYRGEQLESVQTVFRKISPKCRHFSSQSKQLLNILCKFKNPHKTRRLSAPTKWYLGVDHPVLYTRTYDNSTWQINFFLYFYFFLAVLLAVFLFCYYENNEWLMGQNVYVCRYFTFVCVRMFARAIKFNYIYFTLYGMCLYMWRMRCFRCDWAGDGVVCVGYNFTLFVLQNICTDTQVFSHQTTPKIIYSFNAHTQTHATTYRIIQKYILYFT